MKYMLRNKKIKITGSERHFRGSTVDTTPVLFAGLIMDKTLLWAGNLIVSSQTLNFEMHWVSLLDEYFK